MGNRNGLKAEEKSEGKGKGKVQVKEELQSVFCGGRVGVEREVGGAGGTRFHRKEPSSFKAPGSP